MIQKLHNIHAGKKAFILANGPSLSETDPASLDGILIGTNSSHKFIHAPYHWFVHSDTKHLPYHDVSFLMHPPDNTIIFNLECPWESLRWSSCTYIKYIGGDGFSYDLTKGINGANTVCHPALQFAVWIGCNPIVFVGLDLCHVSGRHHFIKKEQDDPSTEFKGMNRTLSACAAELELQGIDVFNRSPYYSFGTIRKEPV
jgi:hypothetical protein